MTILRNTDHFRPLGAGLWELYKAGRLVDIAIHCHGRSIRVHRVVLSVFSPVLQAHLVPGSSASHACVLPDAVPTCLCLDDAIDPSNDLDILQILLEYLYRGEVELPESGVQSLLRTAKFLQIRSLVDAIEMMDCERQSNIPNDIVAIKMEHHSNNQNANKDDLTSIERRPTNSDYSMRIGSTMLVNGAADVERLKVDASPLLMEEDRIGYQLDGQQFDTDENTDHNLENGIGFRYSEGIAREDGNEEQLRLTASGVNWNGGNQSTSTGSPTPAKRFMCKQACNKVFYSKASYLAHVKKSHSCNLARCHRCFLCGFVAGQKGALNEHLEIVHKKSATSNKVFTVIGPTVISNELAKEYLIEAETGRLDEYVNEGPVIKPNGGEILLFKTTNKADDHHYLRDGYNFWQLGNRITKELGLRRIYFKLHRGSRQFAVGFSRYVFKLTEPANQQNQYVLVHYVGDESVYEPMSHGNAREVTLARMPQSTIPVLSSSTLFQILTGGPKPGIS